MWTRGPYGLWYWVVPPWTPMPPQYYQYQEAYWNLARAEYYSLNPLQRWWRNWTTGGDN